MCAAVGHVPPRLYAEVQDGPTGRPQAGEAAPRVDGASNRIARLASRDGRALSCGCEHACAHACRAKAGRVGVGAGRGGRRMGLPPNKASTVFGYEYTEYRSSLSLCVYRAAVQSGVAAGVTRRCAWTGCGRGCERCADSRFVEMQRELDFNRAWNIEAPAATDSERARAAAEPRACTPVAPERQKARA